MMNEVKMPVLVCDASVADGFLCGAEYIHVPITFSESAVRDAAAAAGWTDPDGLDYCPDHTSTGSGGSGGVKASAVGAPTDLRRHPSDHCAVGTEVSHRPHAYQVDGETVTCPGWTAPTDTGSGDHGA